MSFKYDSLPKKNKKQCLLKFLGSNMVYFAQCAHSKFRKTCFLFFSLTILIFVSTSCIPYFFICKKKKMERVKQYNDPDSI